MNFPSPDAFAKLMEEAGLVRMEKYALTLGVTYLHVGCKPVTQ
jgi:ubiquinone/menaquinone biosynthesis C-methylase UbiE